MELIAPLATERAQKQSHSNLRSIQSGRVSRNYKSGLTSAKSLYMNKRREEMKRIERENLKIAQKIFAMKPSIRAVDQLRDFDNHKSISKGMRKITKVKLNAD